jgi:hypothetical protein
LCTNYLSLKALISLGPQNPNWDLKRDIQKKIDKLDALTSKALSELLSTSSSIDQVSLAVLIILASPHFRGKTPVAIAFGSLSGWRRAQHEWY